MIISSIVAMASNRVIGNRGNIPWKIPGEQKMFKEITLGHTVIMGRKTYESIGRPLPGRTNIVITANQIFRPRAASSHMILTVLSNPVLRGKTKPSFAAAVNCIKSHCR